MVIFSEWSKNVENWVKKLFKLRIPYYVPGARRKNQKKNTKISSKNHKFILTRKHFKLVKFVFKAIKAITEGYELFTQSFLNKTIHDWNG